MKWVRRTRWGGSARGTAGTRRWHLSTTPVWCSRGYWNVISWTWQRRLTTWTTSDWDSRWLQRATDLLAHGQYTVSQKKQDTKLLAIISLTVIRFSIFFTVRLSQKFVTKSYTNIPPHPKRVAALPCEIWIRKKWHHSEIRIAINDESQGSKTKNLSCDELVYYPFIVNSAGERIFKIAEHLAKLRAKSLTLSYTPFALHFYPHRCTSVSYTHLTLPTILRV